MTREAATVSTKSKSSPAAVEETASDVAINTPFDAFTPELADDLLRGAEEIAQFMFGDRKHRRKVYHLAGDAKVHLPHFKLGSIICARRTTLLRWIAEQERRR